jgi:hypothetical protein
MTFLTKLSASEWFALGPMVVGATFIWAGGIKAIAPHTFQTHLNDIGLIPRRMTGPAVTVAAGAEVGLGLALLLGVVTMFTYPFTIVLLNVLSAISWWGVRTGKATDCGCYGGFVRPSIKQSVGVNAVFAVLLILALITVPLTTRASYWQLGFVAAGTVIAAGLAETARRFYNRHGRLLFDTNPLKVGHQWRHGWAGGLTQKLDGDVLVAFLGPDCPFCAQWVKVGNAIIQSPRLPKVIGVVAATTARRETFVRDNGINFPVAMISQSLMGRLAQAVPSTVLIENGKIKEQWVGSAPPAAFVDRIKEAFFPEAAQKHEGGFATATAQ